MKKLEPTKLKLNSTNEQYRKYIFYILQVLFVHEGVSTKAEVLDEIGEYFDKTDSELEIGPYGYERYKYVAEWQATRLVQAGYLSKDGRGRWSLTQEGLKLKNLSGDDIFSLVHGAKKTADQITKEDEININLDLLSGKASKDIKNHIITKGPYQFQDLVEYLLTAMGYHISFNAPKGKDGGIDLVAYQDPLGLKTPRIKIQVKHKPDTSIPVSDVRSLNGVLNPQSEVGLFVTSGKFSKDAEIFARENNNHIELIDLDRFVQLWTQYYSKLSDEQKNELPLTPIYFLGT